MNYGYFDADAREYVITRPDTPRVWSNYLGSRKYGGVITAGAGGYSFTRSPAEGRIIRHRYNSVPADLPGRQFYIRDAESKDFWSAAWQATAKPLDLYRTETRFGTGYAQISSTYSNIRAESLYLVPLEAEHEIWRLRLTNLGGKTRLLDIFSFCEFTTEWNLINDLLNLQYTQYIGEARWQDGFIAASSCGRLPEDAENFSNRDQSRHWWMTQSGGKVCGHDCDRESFLGAYGGFHQPAAVVRGSCFGSNGQSDNTCGAIQSCIMLAPGASADVLVLLGIGRAETVGRSIASRYLDQTRIDDELAAVKTHWHDLLETISVTTPEPAFDHTVNTWGAYNALMTFEWSRSCSLVYTGDQRDGYGFRDTVQDCLGVTSMLPQAVRERLILMLSAQDSTGGAQPEVRPWSHEPGKMPPTPASHYRSDDCLWFFNAIPAYVAETGDTDFYHHRIPFADKGDATVLGHLRRAMEFNLERTGAHGLPCGLLADWNDCLKLGYKGESVFVAFQLRLALKTYAEISAALKVGGEQSWALGELAHLDKKISTVCWDGDWFIWAISEDGTVFGTKNRPEGQVYLNTQAWAILSGAATSEQASLALSTVKQRLATEWGVAICAPPFEKTSVKFMRAVLMNPGNKENGGIFSHTQSWAVLAEALAGDGDTAWQYYLSFLPAAQNDRAEIREVEPYVHCQSTHSKSSEKYGRSRVPWLSGTASWAHFTATNYLLGVRPEPAGIRVDPCIPRAWKGFSMKRKFRGRNLHFEINNPSGKNRGVTRMEVDGVGIEGSFLPAASLRDGSKITVTL
jgi:N,N'-diacetylchitobiose phosphorylase